MKTSALLGLTVLALTLLCAVPAAASLNLLGESLDGDDTPAPLGQAGEEASSEAAAAPELWKVRLPGATGLRVRFVEGTSPAAWDAAGNELAVVDGTATVDGDTFLVEAAPGAELHEVVEDVDRTGRCDPRYEDLAAHWAPALYQDEDATRPFADWITAVDFDGDYSGTNNWDNAGSKGHAFRGSLLNEACVYWWAVETTTHYYLGYAMFHPRDWEDTDSAGSKLRRAWTTVSGKSAEHENDMEGALVILRKGSSPWGDLEMVQTQAHNEFWQYSPCGDDLRSLNENVDGKVIMTDGRPTLFAQAKGHGMYGSAKKTNYSGRRGEDGRVYRYAGEPTRGDLVAFRVAPDDEGVLRPVADDLGRHAPRWMGEAADEEGSLPVDYSLRPMSTLWDFFRSPETVPGRADLFITPEGGRPAFCGRRHSDNAANPPWAWSDNDYEKAGLPGGGVGTWFQDPARFYGFQFDTARRGGTSATYKGASFERD